MRVAHVITRMIVGGAQENTLLCCQDLAREHGDQVLLVTGPERGPEGDLLSCSGEVAFSVAYVNNLRRAINPWRDVCGYRELRRVLQAFGPDVVHTHSAKGGVLGRLAASSLRVPVIVHTVHGAPFHPYQGRAASVLYRVCERWAARRCHALISVADAMTEAMVQARVAPRERFTTIHSGMDVDPYRSADRYRLETRRRYDLADDQIVIGKIARLSPLKGHQELIEAARQVVDHAPQARFLLVGGGRLRARLEAQIKRLDLQPFFRFTGLVSPQEIAPLIGGMDVLVHTSLREGLARCIPQALIAGRPVVAFDVDGAGEVVISGETGFLVPPKDTGELTAALIRLASDRELRRSLGDNGRQLAARFDHRATSNQIRELYRRLHG